jgi:hypothetical protein
MIRKFAIALGAATVIGAAALTPTAASAHHHNGGHWHARGGIGIVVAGPAVADDCYLTKETVRTRYGWRTRYVQVCD